MVIIVIFFSFLAYEIGVSKRFIEARVLSIHHEALNSIVAGAGV